MTEEEPARRPAVAGVFYPDRQELIEAELDRLMTPAAERVSARAVVVPHAAWQYSGRVAGEVFRRLNLPRLVVILAPNHSGLGPPGSVMARGPWAIPGGAVSVAEDLARALIAGSPLLSEDERAHRREHAIEVQLPFLRRLRSDVAVVPIVLGRRDLPFCLEVGRGLAATVRQASEPVLLVCSTDLNHYEPQGISNRKDRLAIDALLSLDPGRLHSTIEEQRISMCGVAPAVAMLAALGELESGEAELVRYETSGDVSGDYERVVGYAGLIITPSCTAAAAVSARKMV
jgi:MEMO1 family protein